MWIYRILEKRVEGDGKIWPAYSGHGSGLNNPGMESVHNLGPIPRGRWEIVEWLDSYPPHGPIVARLKPTAHDAFGRTGFLVHGDTASRDNTASHGCIILCREARQTWRDSGDTDLLVTE